MDIVQQKQNTLTPVTWSLLDRESPTGTLYDIHFIVVSVWKLCDDSTPSANMALAAGNPGLCVYDVQADKPGNIKIPE
jgi:hypothetical protein